MSGSDDPRARLRNERQKLKESTELPSDLRDRLLSLSYAMDDDHPLEEYRDPDGDAKVFAPGTIFQYLHVLQQWRKLDGVDYLDTTPEYLNTLAAEMDTGAHPESPQPDGYSRQTVNKFFCAVKAFYSFHRDLGIDPHDIRMFKKAQGSAYDERDMFTNDEVKKLREACTTPRERAFLEMLIFTGQRIRAILTLRIKDIDADQGYYYLNDEVAGLKGATKRGRKRPLFGARRYVREWLQYHPEADNPDADVFVGDPKNPQSYSDRAMSSRSASKLLNRLADRAEIQTEVKAHKFRHFFVTVMVRDYDMDDDTIKFLLGHAKSSNVMNTTYQHVKNDDYIRKAERTLGYESEEKETAFIPPSCWTCGAVLEPTWKSCPECGEVYAPDAAASKEQLDDAMYESGFKVDNEEEKMSLDTMREWVKHDPERAVRLFREALSEDDGSEEAP